MEAMDTLGLGTVIVVRGFQYLSFPVEIFFFVRCLSLLVDLVEVSQVFAHLNKQYGRFCFEFLNKMSFVYFFLSFAVLLTLFSKGSFFQSPPS